MGHNEYGMQAKMWLSFVFIHRMLSFIFFPFFPNQISFLCLFLAVLFSTVLQIRCRFFYCSRFLLTLHKLCFIWQTQAHEVLLHSVSVLDTRYTLKMFLHLRTYSFFLPWLFSLSSSFSISYWNNKIQRRKKHRICGCVCVYIQFLYYFSILSYILWSLQSIKFMLFSCRRKDENLKRVKKSQRTMRDYICVRRCRSEVE